MRDANTVAIIGLGKMGQAMAGCLLRNGFVVYGADTDPHALDMLNKQNGIATSNAAEAAHCADSVVIMVHDADQVEQALFGNDGVLQTLPEGAAIWLASTVPPPYVLDLAKRFSDDRMLLVDGPVSGGQTHALAGNLTVMAGGTNEAMRKLDPIMRACATHIHHVGSVGQGSVTKIINQMLVATHIALTAEALALAEQSGLDLTQLMAVIRQSSGNSIMFEKRAPRMIEGDHQPQATLEVFLKDLAIALDSGAQIGASTPIISTVRSLYAKAAEQLGGRQSDTQLLEFYRMSTTTPFSPHEARS